jgi:hypothetical protein
MIKLYELAETRFYQEVLAETRRNLLEQCLNDRFAPALEPAAIIQGSEFWDRLCQLDRDRFGKLVIALVRENSKRALLELLAARFDQLPELVVVAIEVAQNETLEAWIWLALMAESIEAFIQAMSGECFLGGDFEIAEADRGGSVG